MADAGTRQRLALMRMVQNRGGAPSDAAAHAGEPTKQRDRDLPEIEHIFRTSVESRDLTQLYDMALRVGCPSDVRPKAWPLLCGVFPADAPPDDEKALLQQRFLNLTLLAESMGHLRPQAEPAPPQQQQRCCPLQRATATAAAAAAQPVAGTTKTHHDRRDESPAKQERSGVARRHARDCPKHPEVDSPEQARVLTTVLLHQALLGRFGGTSELSASQELQGRFYAFEQFLPACLWDVGGAGPGAPGSAAPAPPPRSRPRSDRSTPTSSLSLSLSPPSFARHKMLQGGSGGGSGGDCPPASPSPPDGPGGVGGVGGTAAAPVSEAGVAAAAAAAEPPGGGGDGGHQHHHHHHHHAPPGGDMGLPGGGGGGVPSSSGSSSIQRQHGAGGLPLAAPAAVPPPRPPADDATPSSPGSERGGAAQLQQQQHRATSAPCSSSSSSSDIPQHHHPQHHHADPKAEVPASRSFSLLPLSKRGAAAAAGGGGGAPVPEAAGGGGGATPKDAAVRAFGLFVSSSKKLLQGGAAAQQQQHQHPEDPQGLRPDQQHNDHPHAAAAAAAAAAAGDRPPDPSTTPRLSQAGKEAARVTSGAVTPTCGTPAAHDAGMRMDSPQQAAPAAAAASAAHDAGPSGPPAPGRGGGGGGGGDLKRGGGGADAPSSSASNGFFSDATSSEAAVSLYRRSLRAMASRLLEAIPDAHVSSMMLERLLFHPGALPWVDRVASATEGVAESVLAALQGGGGGGGDPAGGCGSPAAAQLGRLRPSEHATLKDALEALLAPAVCSMLCLSTATTSVSSNVVLRVWDAVLCYADPLVAVTRFLSEVLQPLQAKVLECRSWRDVAASVHSCIAAFESWADERQRRTVERCCRYGDAE